MESISEFGLSVSGNGYTEKQKKLIEECNSVISQEGIELLINPTACNWPTSDIFACDIEHNEQGKLVGIGFCQDKRCVYYTSTDYSFFKLSFMWKLIMHNGVSDIECLRFWEVNIRDEQLVWDTMLIGHLLDSSLKSYGLKDMAKRELSISYPSYDDIVGKRSLKAERITLDKQPIELVSRYNALDCYTTYKLYERQKKGMGV